MYPKIYGEVRRALMTRFTYSIYFVIEEETIIVVAVTHQAREEAQWKQRVSRT